MFLNSNDVVNTYLAIHKLKDTNENKIVAKVNLAYELNSIIKELRFNIRDGYYTTIQRLDKTTAQLTNETYSKTTIATAEEVEMFIRTILNPVLEELTDNLIFEMDYIDFNTTLPRNSVYISEKLNKVIEMNIESLNQNQPLLRLAS